MEFITENEKRVIKFLGSPSNTVNLSSDVIHGINVQIEAMLELNTVAELLDLFMDTTIELDNFIETAGPSDRDYARYIDGKISIICVVLEVIYGITEEHLGRIVDEYMEE